MTSKLNVIVPTTFPEGMGVTNSGVGLTQLPPGMTKISGNGNLASVGAAIVGGVPGQFHQSTKMDANWLNSSRFKR